MLFPLCLVLLLLWTETTNTYWWKSVIYYTPIKPLILFNITTITLMHALNLGLYEHIVIFNGQHLKVTQLQVSCCMFCFLLLWFIKSIVHSFHLRLKICVGSLFSSNFRFVHFVLDLITCHDSSYSPGQRWWLCMHLSSGVHSGPPV